MSDTQRWTRIGTLAAFSMLLGYAETFIPIPLPGVKLGLANIAVLVELACGDALGAAYIALIKVLASGFLFGSPLTMLYSTAGTLLSLAGMIPLSHLRTLRLWMVSVVGALLHEVGQLFVAQLMLKTTSIWYTLPVLMVAGCVTGIICGLLAESLRTTLPREDEFGEKHPTEERLQPQRPNARTIIPFIALVTFAIIVLHVDDIPALALCAALAIIAFVVSGTKMSSLARMLVPLATVGILTFALQLLTDPTIAALASARASLSFGSLVVASRAFMAIIDLGNLTGTIAWLVSPLTRLGMQTSGFVLAFDVAVRLIPVVSDLVKEERLELRELRSRLPVLIHEVCLRAATLS